MPESYKPGASPERIAEAEIVCAIRYLDPEFEGKENGKDDGTLLTILVSSVIWLTSALTYVCLYIRTL